jgi:O-antigen/teichoic acid export membrane protein
MGILDIKNNALFTRFFSVLGIDILVKASGFFLLPLFLRLMTQSEFGLYNYIISIVQTFSLVLNLGLYVAQSKLYHNYTVKEQKGQLLFTINITLFAVNVLMCVIILVFGLDDWLVKNLFDNKADYKFYKAFIMLALLVSVFTFTLTNYFYTTEKIKQVKGYNLCRIILINTVSLLALFIIKENAVSIRLGFTYGVEFILLLVFSSYIIKEMVAVFNRDMMWKSLKLGIPIMVSAVFGIVVNFSDKFLLQRYGSLVDLSNYYLAFSFASIIPLIFSSVQNVWLPVFLQEKDVQRNFEKTKKLLSKLLFFFLILSLAVWVLFNLLLWIHVIPVKYDNVIWILPILLITQIFSSLTPIFSNYLVYFEKTSLVSLSGLMVSVVSICLGLWFIPLWGVLGAALTTLIINFIYLAIYYYLVLFLKTKHLALNKNLV